jgi:hypothetical protein
VPKSVVMLFGRSENGRKTAHSATITTKLGT